MKLYRALSAFIAVVMIITMLPAGAFAADSKSILIYEASDGATVNLLEAQQSLKAFGVDGKFTNASSYRYYDQLTQTEKIIYNDIVNQKAGIETANGDFSVEITNGDDFNKNEAQMRQSLFMAMAAVVDDVPELYWILYLPYDISVERPANSNLFFNFDFKVSASHVNAFSQLKNEYKNTVNAAKNFNVTGSTTYEKIKSIADGICDMAEYATEATGSDVKVFYPSSCLLAPHRTVCDGYSKAFKMICDANDIPSLIIVGTGYSYDGNNEYTGGGHAWNYVQMDDGKWYAVDTTWMDDYINRDDFFLVGSETKDYFQDNFLKSHVPSGARYFDQREAFYYPSLALDRYDPFPEPELSVRASVNGEEYNGEYTSGDIVIQTLSNVKVFYSVDGGEWTQMESDTVLAQDGEHTYSFKSVSGEKQSEVTSIVTKREQRIPVLSVAVTGLIGRWTNGDVVFKLDAENINSGATYYYSVDGGKGWTEIFGDTLTVSDSTYSKYIFKCINGAGSQSNRSEEYLVMVDKSAYDENAPVIEVDLTGKTGEWTNTDLSFKLSAENADSGAAYYYNNGSGWVKLDGDTFTLSENANEKYVFKCVNGNGAQSRPTDIYNVMIEKDVPELSVTVTGKTGEWTKDNVSFRFGATNMKSGTAYYYSVDGGKSWTEIIGNTLTLSENTNSEYLFKCVSGAGSESSVSPEYSVMISKTVPKKVTVELQNSKGESIGDGAKIEGGVTVKMPAKSAETAEYQYSVNGGEWKTVEGDALSFAKSGEYSVSFRAQSVSGIVSETTVIKFTITESVIPKPDKPEPDKPEPIQPEPDKPNPEDPTQDELIMGDINGDGKITTVDAKWILQYIANSRKFDERQNKAADLNADGKLSVVDVKWVLQIIAGIRS